MKHSDFANLMIFEFIRPEIKSDFLFGCLLVAYSLHIPKKVRGVPED